MDKKEKTGVLNVRDLVNVGLFSVLIFIATFLSGILTPYYGVSIKCIT